MDFNKLSEQYYYETFNFTSEQYYPNGFEEKFKKYLQKQNREDMINILSKINLDDLELKILLNLCNLYNLSENNKIYVCNQIIFQYCAQNDTTYQEAINEEEFNKRNDTVAMWLTRKQKLIPQQIIYLHSMQKSMDTLKQLMKDNQMPVPQYWENDKVMTIFDQAYFSIIPSIEGHKSNEQDEDGFTVAMLVALNNIDVPQCWQHDPSIQNIYGQTVAYIQALQSKIPDKQWQHNPAIQTINGNTVAMRLAFSGLIPTKEWEHKSDIQSSSGTTVAMILAYNNIVPHKQWEHKPEIQQKGQVTVAMRIIEYCNQVPKQCWYHDPTLKDEDGRTAAMYFVLFQHKIPPKQWQHDPLLRTISGFTVEDFLISRNLDVPEEWQTNPNKTLTDEDKQIIEQYCKYYNIKVNYNINSEFCLNNKNSTIAMFLVEQKQDIPKQWRHKPEMINYCGQTMAMLYAENGVIPPKEWEHDPNIQDYIGSTVAMYLAYNGIIPPKYWEHDPKLQNDNDMTVAFILVLQKIYPPLQWMHDDYIYMGSFMFLSLLLETIRFPISDSYQKGTQLTIFDQAIFRQIPNIEGHQPDEQDSDGFTIAMILAINNIDIPECWYHKPEIQNKYGKTVAMIYIDKGILPSKRWLHNYKLEDTKNETIIQKLDKQQILQYNNKQICNAQIQNKKAQCQICFQEGKINFIKTTCKHQICQQCFMDLDEINRKQCPCCKKLNWYYKKSKQLLDMVKKEK